MGEIGEIRVYGAPWVKPGEAWLVDTEAGRYPINIKSWRNKPCRLYAGSLNRNGYGFIQISTGKKRTKLMVHILAWRLENGCRVPRGKVLNHLCRNRACYEVSHLEAVSVRENTLRGEGPTARRFRDLNSKK